jgi:uncharacterized membrane protein
MSFIEEHFLNPVLQNGWFNPVNTAAYSVILIVAVYVVYNMLRRMKIHIDRNFALALLPFIFWGSSTRVLHDAAYAGALSPELNAFYGLPIFPTPGSYIITFSLALFVLLASLLVQKYSRFPYWKTMTGIGCVLCLINVALIPVVSLLPLLLIVPVTALFTGVLVLPHRMRNLTKFAAFRRLIPPSHAGILGAHFLDATATTFALLTFGYVEQHVLPRTLFPVLGFETMFLLKTAVVLPVLWIVDKYTEDRDFRNFLKIVILILGLAPGLRDLIRLVAAV